MRNSMKSIFKLAVTTCAFLFLSTFAAAADHGAMNHSQGHGEMDHSKMNHSMEAGSSEAMAVGVIHSVSRLNRMVNLTHEPVPELNWPAMTMDLKVADSVDLKSIKTGEKVKFHLKLGEDKQYVITHIM